MTREDIVVRSARRLALDQLHDRQRCLVTAAETGFEDAQISPRTFLETHTQIIKELAAALGYANKQGFVHRDVKPANILFRENGIAVLSDFGIAKATSGDTQLTRMGLAIGTPDYMSPEQALGKPVDGRSDLFSLGVMLYQLLTGKLPFTGDSMTTLMWNISREPHPDILAVRPDLAPCLKAIIDKALQKTANDRYSRGAHMVNDLRACAASLAN